MIEHKLVWNVIEIHGTQEERIASFIDHNDAQDFAMRKRKARPKAGYDVRQAPKEKKVREETPQRQREPKAQPWKSPSAEAARRQADHRRDF